MTSDREIWADFMSALEAVQAAPDDAVVRQDFIQSYRAELVLVMLWLHKLRIGGGNPVIADAPPDNCNLCGSSLADTALFIDGQTVDGSWSFMCVNCYSNVGVGVGWGVGQLYRLLALDETGDRSWVCIAGGPPPTSHAHDE